MNNIHHSVLYLRSRSLSARYAILWGGSLVIFLAVSFLWVGQMKYKLATAFQFGPGAPLISPETNLFIASSNVPRVETPAASAAPQEVALQPVVSAPSSLGEDVNGIVGLIEKGTAGLFSLLRGKGIPSGNASGQEGQELDQFLKYQEEYYRPLPANQ